LTPLLSKTPKGGKCCLLVLGKLEQNPGILLGLLYLLLKLLSVGPVGIEPTTHGLKVRCSTD